MTSPNEQEAPSNTSEEGQPSTGMEPAQGSRAAQRFGCPNSRRHLGEICPETVLIMPFVVPLMLAMRLRKRLRRRLGRKAGNAMGKAAIISFGGPPLLLACVAVLMMRLVLKVLTMHERVMKSRRTA